MLEGGEGEGERGWSSDRERKKRWGERRGGGGGEHTVDATCSH